MADDVYTTLLDFQTNAASKTRDIKTITDGIKALELELGKLTKSTDSADLIKYAAIRAKIAEERLIANRLALQEIEGQKKAERELAAVTSDRAKKQFEQIKANSTLLAEFNKRTKGQAITAIPDIQSKLLAEAPALIKATEKARADELKQATNAQREKIRLYNLESRVIRKMAGDIRENAQLLKGQAERFGAVAQVGLGLGVGVVGGAFAFASKYVRDAKEATATTIAWKAEQEKLAKSSARIGEVVATSVLPLLQTAREISEKAADFAERNPDAIRAAINIGAVVATLGAVGVAVSKGIKLYADAKMLTAIPLQLRAGELQLAAAREQLVAAKLRAGLPTGGGVPAGPAGAASLLKLGPLAAILGGAAAYTAIGTKASQFGAKVFGYDSPMQFWEELIQKVQESNPALKGFIDRIREFTDASSDAAPVTGVRASPQFEAILKAYEDYKRDDLALVQKHYADREKIIQDSLQAQIAENQQYLSSIRRVNSQTGSALRAATKSYEEQSIKEEQQYAQQRAQIIRDGGIEIQKIEAQLQESLRKLRLDHEDRVADLVANRDALGLVKEQQRYTRERSEQIRQTNLEIRQRRADLALRLQDLEQSYQQERAQRFADYQARLAEIRASAAEQLREIEASHREEINQIRQQKVARLQEADAQFREERQRRNAYFIDQIRNLDAALLGERSLRDRRQKEMIAELDAFLLKYKQGLGTLLTSAGGTLTSKAAGGYASYGMHLLGDAVGGGPGKREYVLGGGLTELAERVLGGGLTNDKLSSLFNMIGGGSNRNVTYNDSRRIDSRISASDRERLRDDTLNVLMEVFQ